MSVNNALENDEVNNHQSKKNTNNPPIIGSFDGSDIPPEKNWKLASGFQKKVETSNEDSVSHRTDHEIIFKSEDIKKKGKIEYFVNVEGAEQRKKEAARKAKKEAAIAEREAIAAKAAANKEAAEKKAAEAKAKIEAQKQQKAEDTRVIGELKEKAKIRKKQNRAVAREEKRRKKTEKRAAFWRGVGNFFKKIKNLLFGGWHKIVTFIVILIIITIPVGFIIANGIEREARKEESDSQQHIADLNNEILELYDEDKDANKDKIVDNLEELDDLSQTKDSAIMVMNWAIRLEDMELYEKYHQICIDRGGCAEDTKGKG